MDAVDAKRVPAVALRFGGDVVPDAVAQNLVVRLGDALSRLAALGPMSARESWATRPLAWLGDRSHLCLHQSLTHIARERGVRCVSLSRRSE